MYTWNKSHFDRWMKTSSELILTHSASELSHQSDHFLKGSTTEPVQQVFLFLRAGEVLAERELLDTVRRKRPKKATSIWEE